MCNLIMKLIRKEASIKWVCIYMFCQLCSMLMFEKQNANAETFLINGEQCIERVSEWVSERQRNTDLIVILKLKYT